MKKCMGCGCSNQRKEVEFVGAFCRECYDGGCVIKIEEKAKLEYVINEDLVAADLEKLRLSREAYAFIKKQHNEKLRRRFANNNNNT